MNQLTQTIASGDLEAIKAVIAKTHFKVIIAYLDLHINHDIPETILTCLLTQLPHWEDPSLHLHDSIAVHNATSILLCKASLDNLKIILNHPTFTPSPILDEYVAESSLETFKMLLASSKIHDSTDTLETLLEHNDAAKMKAYLDHGITKKNLPSADKVAQLIKKYKATSTCLALLFVDHRINISKVDLSYPFPDGYADQRIRDALMKRIQECIASPAKIRSRHTNLPTGKEEAGYILQVLPGIYSLHKQDESTETMVAPVTQDRMT